MTNTLAHSFVTRLPQVKTSRVHELQWSIDWWKSQHDEAKIAANNAWRIYQDAIDALEAHATIDELFTVATTFDAIAAEAYFKWQDAKRDYLALCN